MHVHVHAQIQVEGTCACPCARTAISTVEKVLRRLEKVLRRFEKVREVTHIVEQILASRFGGVACLDKNGLGRLTTAWAHA